jgi:transcriptional regulator with XRE-family HTH domain
MVVCVNESASVGGQKHPAAARRRGLSQEALAVDAGIDRTYVSRLERGLENPSVAVLEKLAIALEASIPDLFVVPAKGEAKPRPLKAGRRPKQ